MFAALRQDTFLEIGRRLNGEAKGKRKISFRCQGSILTKENWTSKFPVLLEHNYVQRAWGSEREIIGRGNITNIRLRKLEIVSRTEE
jgi:hypothetical protein